MIFGFNYSFGLISHVLMIIALIFVVMGQFEIALPIFLFWSIVTLLLLNVRWRATP